MKSCGDLPLAKLASGRSAQTLQATALVHEAYLRLVNGVVVLAISNVPYMVVVATSQNDWQVAWVVGVCIAKVTAKQYTWCGIFFCFFCESQSFRLRA